MADNNPYIRIVPIKEEETTEDAQATGIYKYLHHFLHSYRAVILKLFTYLL